MEYTNVDETARKQAYERVKQLAEAIKKIRKKYYLCFNKISDSDKQRYGQLIAQMQSVATENGLEKTYEQIMEDIDTQYNVENQEPSEDNRMQNRGNPESIYQKFIKAVEMQAECIILAGEALVKGDTKLANAYFKKARMCQKRVKEYEELLINEYSRLRLSVDKFTVLKNMLEEQAKEYMLNLCKDCNKLLLQDPLTLNSALETIADCKNMTQGTEKKLEATR